MAKIIMLRGNSGSGKTTTGKTLQQKLGRGTLLISQDVVRREMLWVNDGPATKAVGLLSSLVEYGSRTCEYTILEGILNAEWYRPLFKTAARLFDGEIFAYYFDIPFEETLRRHVQKPNAQEFGEAQMRRWWKEKDYIGFLREEAIGPDLSAEEIVDRIYRDVTLR